MAATVAAHWYQHELGAPTSEEASSRFPFLRLPYKRRDSANKQQRPTSSKSSKSFRHHSAASPQRAVRRQSFTTQSATTPAAGAPAMKQPTKGRAAYWRRKLGVQLIPPLAYYGWGSAEEVKKVAQQSRPMNSVPPNVRTATTDDEIDEKDADDMILLTEMRAPSALGGLTLVDSTSEDPDEADWPLRDPMQ